MNMGNGINVFKENRPRVSKTAIVVHKTISVFRFPC